MKISKKDLRRIIFENIALEEQSQATARGARKAKTKGEDERGTRTDADVGELLRRVSEETIIRILDPIIKAKELVSYNVQVKLGQKSVVVNQGSGRTAEGDLSRKELREINKEIKKALKQDPDTVGSVGKIRDQLKVGRRVKLNYKYVSGSEPNVAVAEEPDIQAQSGQTPEATPVDKTYTYEGETGKGDGYEYKVDKDSGCWLARKLPAGKFFSMKKYPKNMKNLDTKFPKARTDEQRAKCPSADKNPSLPKKKSPESSGPDITPLGEIVLNIDGTKTTFKMAKDYFSADASSLTQLFEIKSLNNTGLPGKYGVANGKRFFIAYKMRSTKSPGQVTAAALIAITADGMKAFFFDQDTKPAGTMNEIFDTKEAARLSNHPRSGNDAFFKGEGGKPLNLIKIAEKFKSIEGKSSDNVSESAFGKSRGTLIREHYWEDTKMKISRRQLQKIILENILQEEAIVYQSSVNTVANLLVKGSATQQANALHTLASIAKTQEGMIKVVQSLNQLVTTGQVMNAKVLDAMLRVAHGGSDPKAAAGARALRWNLKLSSAAREAVKAGTWSARSIKDFPAIGRAATGGIRTAQAAVRTIMKAPEAANAVRQVGSGVVKSGQALTKVPQGSQLVNTAASAVTASPVPEVAANASKLTRFLKFLGPLSVAMFVLDVYYAPVALLADGELIVPGTGGLLKWKVGIGINDMKTPWGQLAYRKRVGMPPAKPSDFNDEYKNVIATIIWNQRREGEEGTYAKKWTQKAIADDLIDIAAWKTYLDPWREAEEKIKEAERTILADDEKVDESEFEGEGSIASVIKGVGKPEKQAQKGKKSISSEKISKIQKIIGDRGDGKWSKDTNIKLGAYVTAADPAVITTPTRLEWWKDWKNSAPKIENISVGGRTMSFGTAANPQLRGNLSSLLKVIEFIDESRKNASSEVNESLSHGALIRKRYWGRY